MSAYFTSKLVDEIKELAVIAALTKLGIELGPYKEDVSKLLVLLQNTDPVVHGSLTGIVDAYHKYATFCEEREKEGNGGMSITNEQNEEYMRLSGQCEEARLAFIQILSK